MDTEITMLTAVDQGLAHRDREYQAIQLLPGIGIVLEDVMVAEVGEVTRFKTAGQLGRALYVYFMERAASRIC